MLADQLFSKKTYTTDALDRYKRNGFWQINDNAGNWGSYNTSYDSTVRISAEDSISLTIPEHF